MTTMDAEVFEAFRSVGVADDKAILAAQALGKRDPDTSTLKQDVSIVKQDVASLKQDMSTVRQDVGSLRQDVATLKVDVSLMKWTSGITVALLVTLLFKVFHG